MDPTKGLRGQPCPPPLELLGALSSLLIHDLVNCVAVISGNAQFAQLVLNDPAQANATVESILKAANAASDLLARCRNLRRTLTNSVPHGDAAEAVDTLVRFQEAHPAWSLKKASKLSGEVALSAQWIGFAVQQIIGETGVDQGSLKIARIDLETVRASRPSMALGAAPSHFLEVKIVWVHQKPFSLDQIKSSYSNLPLLAVNELIRIAHGAIESRPGPGKTHEVVIWIPFT